MTSWDKLSVKGDKASGRRTHIQQRETRRDTNTRPREDHPTQGNKKEDKLGDKLGDKGRQADKVGDKLKDKLEDKVEDKMGDKAPGRRTHHPAKAHMWGERQAERRCREGRHTIQQRETSRKTS